MKLCYINLDSAADRRDFLEANLRRHVGERWAIERVAAVERRDLAEAGVNFSRIRDVEACCFLSHIRAITANAALDDDLMIVEDDAMFGPTSASAIQHIVERSPRDKWDIIYTDAVIPGIPTMLALFNMRRVAKEKVQLINVAALSPDPALIPVAGSTAYVVNKRALPKLAKELRELKVLPAQYDIYLWQRVAARTLQLQMAFPFLTTISPFADATQVQGEEPVATELLWNAFRRLVWAHSDLTDAEKTLAKIAPNHFDKPGELMGKILAGILSKNFVSKKIQK